MNVALLHILALGSSIRHVLPGCTYRKCYDVYIVGCIRYTYIGHGEKMSIIQGLKICTEILVYTDDSGG